MRTNLDILLKPQQSLRKKNLAMENQFNKKNGAKIYNYSVNDKVYVEIYKQNKFNWQHAKITEKVGNVMFNVMTGNQIIRCHVNQLRRRYNNENKQQSIDFSSTFSSSPSELVLEAPPQSSIGSTSEVVPNPIHNLNSKTLTEETNLSDPATSNIENNFSGSESGISNTQEIMPLRRSNRSRQRPDWLTYNN